MTHMIYPKTYDVIVVGGGHAGTEAALAAARMGAQTLLLTHNIETLGQMSCNPSIGGIGKGHLVRELDALGGAMALATDKSGIQFRRLNASKGAAVRATRAQADRILYKAAIREMLENQENLELFQQSVDDVTLDGDRISGVITAMGVEFKARAVVLTAGTFCPAKSTSVWKTMKAAAPATRRQIAGRTFARIEPAARPSENRHAAAHRRAHD